MEPLTLELLIRNIQSNDDAVRAATVRDALQRDVFWQLPYDKKIRQGAHLGRPIVMTYPQSVAARSFIDLATVISGGRLDFGVVQLGSETKQRTPAGHSQAR